MYDWFTLPYKRNTTLSMNYTVINFVFKSILWAIRPPNKTWKLNSETWLVFFLILPSLHLHRSIHTWDQHLKESSDLMKMNGGHCLRAGNESQTQKLEELSWRQRQPSNILMIKVKRPRLNCMKHAACRGIQVANWSSKPRTQQQKKAKFYQGHLTWDRIEILFKKWRVGLP